MGFDVGADAYGQFMGRYSEPLADAFVQWASVRSGEALDVGCGAGPLTQRRADRLGPESVRAVDPSESFVAATRKRCGLWPPLVWDYGGNAGPLSVFWSAVRDIDPTSEGEGERAGTREGHLAELFAAAGLTQIRTTVLTVAVAYEGFEEWSHPFTLGVGPAGGLCRRTRRYRPGGAQARCAELLHDGRSR
ncbi:class I SAM-dependent methyltransferase [Mycobacterium sp. URHB0021]